MCGVCVSVLCLACVFVVCAVCIFLCVREHARVAFARVCFIVCCL